VDVSKKTLDGRVGLKGPSVRVERTPQGVDALMAFCHQHGAELVVMEATGGYERLPYSLLWERGMACAVVNPRSVRRFAEALGFLEKTDKIDCGVISRYAEVKGIIGQQPASETQERLRALTTRLRQLTEAAVVQKNQRRLVTQAEVLASCERTIAFLNGEMRLLEPQIANLLGSDPLWKALDASFREIKGVADRTVARVMAEIPEIGTLSNKAVAKLAGLAPLANDSGQRQGRRSVRGGRSDVRSIIFVVADLARRHNPDLAAFHKRLTEAGKPKMVVRIALARKLLVRLNAKARDVRSALAAKTALAALTATPAKPLATRALKMAP
jgi:transposase